MTADWILAHDVGTSGTKSSLVRADGGIEASRATPHRTHAAPGGIAEQDAADWWAGVCANTRSLLAAQPGAAARLAGVGVSGHMLGCLPLDAAGRPLRRHMIHADCRAVAEAEFVAREIGADEIYRVTGNLVDARSPLCKMRWIRRHEPDIHRRAARYVQSKDFIVGSMTGSFSTTDLSDASHAQWLDIRRRAVARDLFQALELDPDRIPEPRRAIDVVGRVSREAAAAMGIPEGLPVVAGGGDGACANAGAGAVRPGVTYGCIGTTAWVASIRPEPFIDPKRRVFDICTLDGEAVGLYGTVQAAGRALDWAMDVLGEKGFAEFDRHLASIPAGCDGLVFLPYLEGERSPIWDARARGVYFGLTPAHRREHLLRATVEGVSYALRSVIEALREVGPIPALRLIGGGGQSAAWRRMLADIAGVEIQVLSTQAADATSLGAAIAAGVGVGLFRDLAHGAASIAVTESHAPDPAARAIYDARYALYTSLYPALKPAFAQLAETLAG
jgi:xylulokinase